LSKLPQTKHYFSLSSIIDPPAIEKEIKNVSGIAKTINS